METQLGLTLAIDDDDLDMEEKKNEENSELYDIIQGEYEINSHFKLRKEVYDKGIAKGFTKQRALIVSNAFQNHYYMGCVYVKEVMDEIDKCWPDSVKKK